MRGKRAKNHKTPWRILGRMALVTLLLLVVAGDPVGVAVKSPLEGGPAPSVQPQPRQEQSAASEALSHYQTFSPAEEPEENDPQGDQKASPEELQEAAPEQEEAAWGPVPEGAAVEDTYFEDAVFLGDSRTDGFRLYSGLKQGTYLCATGATVESVFTRKNYTNAAGQKVTLLDALADVPAEKADKIYIMLGINELGWSGTEIFRRQCTLLIQRIQTDHPQAHIVVQSILPVSAAQDAKKSYVNNQRIKEYNEVWQQLAEEMGFSYLDVASAVTGEDGCLPQGWSTDGVHLNKKGCGVWLDYLRRHPLPGTVEASQSQQVPAAPARPGDGTQPPRERRSLPAS